MCTAFPYCRVGVQRLLEVIYAIIFTGGLVAGPRALRPERLQWLTTSAVNRQAFIRNTLWSLTVGPIARAAPNRSIYEVDTVRSGALEELPFSRKDVASPGVLRLLKLALFSINSSSRRKPGSPRSNFVGPDFRRGDEFGGVRSNFKQLSNFRRASAHFFSRILIGHEAAAETFPPAFLKLESGAILR